MHNEIMQNTFSVSMIFVSLQNVFSVTITDLLYLEQLTF